MMDKKMTKKNKVFILNSKIIRKNWRLYSEYFFLTVVWNFIPIIVALIINYLLDSLNERITTEYFLAVGGLLLISLANVLILKRSVVIEVLIRFFSGKQMRKNILNEILEKTGLTGIQSGTIVDVLNNDINTLEYIVLTEIDFVVQVIFMFGSFIILGRINSGMMLFSIMPMIFLIFLTIKLDEVLKYKYSEQRDENIAFSSFLDEVIRKREIIQFYGSEQVITTLKRLSFFRGKSKLKKEKLGIFVKENIVMINNLGIALVLIFCIFLVKFNYEITIGELSIFINYISYGYLCVESLNTAYSTMKYSDDSIHRLSEVLGANEVKVVDILSKDFSENIIETREGEVEKIEFRNYRISSKDIVHNFVINKGDIVLLQGNNGSGKSRFLKSILGKEEYQGQILIDGIEAKKYSGKIGYISQNHNLFNDTILNNLTLFQINMDIEKVQKALEKTNLYGDMRGWKWNSDRKIGVNGERLSSGQKQRLLISRMLYEDASICLLDNPVGALDTQNRKEILSELLHMNNKIIFICNEKVEIGDLYSKMLYFDNCCFVEKGVTGK